jgi:hypothetical protein
MAADTEGILLEIITAIFGPEFMSLVVPRLRF